MMVLNVRPLSVVRDEGFMERCGLNAVRFTAIDIHLFGTVTTVLLHFGHEIFKEKEERCIRFFDSSIDYSGGLIDH